MIIFFGTRWTQQQHEGRTNEDRMVTQFATGPIVSSTGQKIRHPSKSIRSAHDCQDRFLSLHQNRVKKDDPKWMETALYIGTIFSSFTYVFILVSVYIFVCVLVQYMGPCLILFRPHCHQLPWRGHCSSIHPHPDQHCQVGNHV